MLENDKEFIVLQFVPLNYLTMNRDAVVSPCPFVHCDIQALKLLDGEETTDNELRAKFSQRWSRTPSGDLYKPLRAGTLRARLCLSKFSARSCCNVLLPSLLPPRGSQLPQHLGQGHPGRPGGEGALQYPLRNDRPAVQTRERAECSHPVRQPNQNTAGQRGPYAFNMFQSFRSGMT